jgi:hypothetical protein
MITSALDGKALPIYGDGRQQRNWLHVEDHCRALVAVLDTLTLGFPLASLWRYILYNAYHGVSATFGVKPWDYYFLGEYGVWGTAVAVPLLLAAQGARRMPLLALCAAIILAAHSAVPHKEYRFIYPTLLLVMILAGLGLVECTRLGARVLTERSVRGAFAPILAASICVFCWLAVAAQVWAAPTLAALRNRDHDRLLAALFVAGGPAPCGIGVYGPEKNGWVASGGYAYLQQPAPLYWPADHSELLADAPGFDTLVYRKPLPRHLGFRTLKCFGPICVARRAGRCRRLPVAAMPIPTPLLALAKAKGIPAAAMAESGDKHAPHRRKEAKGSGSARQE